MESISQVLMELLKDDQSPLSKSYLMIKLCREWHQWLPSLIAEHTQPLKLHRHTLWIRVKTSAWIYELNFHRRHIINQINEKIYPAQIKHIRWVVGEESVPSSDTQNLNPSNPLNLIKSE